MSERMKKSHIEVTIHGKSDVHFILPQKALLELMRFLKPFEKTKGNDQFISADKVFKDLHDQHGKVGTTIRGFRSRDGMTQVELAERLSIRQSHVSQIENDKRVIGKKMAQKLAQIFKTDYRLFL